MQRHKGVFKVHQSINLCEALTELRGEILKAARKRLEQTYDKSISNSSLVEMMMEEFPNEESAQELCSKFYYKKFKEVSRHEVDNPYNFSIYADVWKVGSFYYVLFTEGWGIRGTFFRVVRSTKGFIPVNPDNSYDGKALKKIFDESGGKGALHATMLDKYNFYEVDPAWGKSSLPPARARR